MWRRRRRDLSIAASWLRKEPSRLDPLGMAGILVFLVFFVSIAGLVQEDVYWGVPFTAPSRAASGPAAPRSVSGIRRCCWMFALSSCCAAECGKISEHARASVMYGGFYSTVLDLCRKEEGKKKRNRTKKRL